MRLTAARFAMAALLGTPVFAPAQLPLQETRSTLEKWVETRQLISRTRADWQADKETLAQTLDLFQRELDLLQEKMTTVSTNTVQAEREQALAQAERRERVDALETATRLATGLEQKLARLAPAFPQPLMEKIDPLFKRIPSDPDNTKIPGVQRLQNVVGILNELDKFNAAVTVVNEIRKSPSGAEVQVETLYLGLAQAYFVDTAGEYSGVGIPSLQGWEWKEQSELADKIKSTLAMYKNAAPAGFVHMPVQIK